MNRGIIGGGHIGATAATLFVRAGHRVTIDLPAAPFAGTIVVDAMNYYPGRDGNLRELDEDRVTSSELLARHLTGARIVKAFNTMYWETLRDGDRPDLPREQRLSLLLAGDDQDAAGVVAELIEQLGFAAVITGDLAEGGRRQQPGTPVYATDLTPQQAAAALAGG